MKKLIAGIGMMLTGFLGIAILCAGAMCSQATIDHSKDFRKIWWLYEVTPVAKVFVGLAVLGVIFSILGALDKRR